MSEVRVPYGDSAADTAVLLLEAVSKADMNPDVVTHSPDDGSYGVPEEIAKAAGVDYEVDGKPVKKAAAKTAAKKSGN